MITAQKHDEVLIAAQQLLARSPDWAGFYRAILGRNGVVRKFFPTLEEQSDFEKSEAYLQIQQMLRQLRERGPSPVEDEEPTKVITVRLPKSLHEALGDEAHQHRTSINKLCISKLMQLIDNELVPPERS